MARDQERWIFDYAGQVSRSDEQLSSVERRNQLKGSVYAPAQLLGADLLVGTTNGYLYRLDHTGQTKAFVRLATPVYATPVVHRDFLYVSAYDNRLYRVDPATLQVVTERRTCTQVGGRGAKYDRANPYANLLVADDHDLILLCSYNRVSALDLALEERAAFDLPHDIVATPVYDHQHQCVWIADTGGHVVALDIVTFKPRARYRVFGSTTASLAISATGIVVTTELGRIYAFARDGSGRQWDCAVNVRFGYTAPLLINHCFMVTHQAGKILCLDAFTGEFLWETEQESEVKSLPTAIHGSPVMTSGGHLLVTSNDGAVFGFTFQARSE
ncbi:outer membrane protein assembly factor BamB family protein [Deinococcus arcticus]|uniref:outer membrane protein assembly factor BamB family protein n=1 Tax=Deinococcus arcticus TaxID=2136176 RepID=UPI0013049F4B|nr:PQQ-binding-like beta-propeller repeat protein [Deinococcus arcticus]